MSLVQHLNIQRLNLKLQQNCPTTICYFVAFNKNCLQIIDSFLSVSLSSKTVVFKYSQNKVPPHTNDMGAIVKRLLK